MVKKHIDKIPKRRKDSHKGDYGHVFVIAGSCGMTGAAYLVSQAAMRSGSGLVTCGIPASLNPILEVKTTEAMTLPLKETKEATLGIAAEKEIVEFSKKVDCLAVGPGLSGNVETKELVKIVLQKIDKPIVLDADGLNAVADYVSVIKKRKGPTVLTPHPGEMARLIKKDVSSVQSTREGVAKELAKSLDAVVVLKGHKSIVARPSGECYINETGNSGMSSGGVGDVLTGIIASFIGQGIDVYSAAILGVYIHGKAGDMAANEKGQFGMIASDILYYLPYAIKEVV